MARRGHGCRCCGCSFNNIFRCEQLSVNLWNQSGELPVVTCDSATAAGNLTAVSQWITSGSFARGGSLTIDLDAAGLNLAASSTGNGSIQTSLFQGTAIASSAISGSVRSISMNSDQRLAVLDQTHAISVRSCKTQSGRFVTAYAGATPRSTDVPGITPRMSVKFRQQGEPGFTNQFIDGLENASVYAQNNPYWMTQACRVAVYRDGEYVGEVTRDPSLCAFLPDDELTVSESSGTFPDVEAKLAAVNDEIYWLGRVAGRPLTQAESDELSAIGPEINGLQITLAGLLAASQDWAQQQTEGFLDGYLPPRWRAMRTADNQNPTESAIAGFLLYPLSWKREQAATFHNQETNAEFIAQLLAKQSRRTELINTRDGYQRPLTQKETQDLEKLISERNALSNSLRIAKVRDWIVQHDGIIRLSGYKASIGFPSNGDAIGGKNIADLHAEHAYWSAGISPSVIDRWYDTRAENAVFMYARAGQRIRLVVWYGGSGTLTMEPSGAILGTFGEETSPEGSYLVVSKYDDDCMPSGWQGQRKYDNVDDGWQGLGGYRSYQAPLGLTVTEPRRLSQRRYEFNSFVVDKTPPSIVSRQVNDFVAGDWPTEVNVASADYFTGVYRIEASPLFFADEPVVGGFTHRAEYASRPLVMGDPGFYRATNPLLKDRAHNFPLLTIAVEFTIHEEMSGAKATFAAAGDETISRDSPLASIDLVFDEPVVGVMKRHFTLQAYGKRADNTFGEIVLDDDLVRISPANIVGLSWTSGNVCRITFDTTTQLPASLWRIVFQPDDAVIATDDAGYRAKWSYIHTPPAAANGDTPERFEAEVWRVLRGESQQPNPVEWNAAQKKWKWRGEDANVPTPGDAEPCILAARFAWIRPQANVRQLIDTTTRLTTVNQRTVDETVAIGDIASVSASVAEPDPEQTPVLALSSSSTVSLPASGGSFHANHDADSFSPNAPPDPDTATSVPYSYFGMSTTIYPSPARMLSACAAPLEPQKHFSAMMAANNYTTITAQMATHVPVNGNTYAGRLAVPDTKGRPHAQFSPNWEEILPYITEPLSPPFSFNLANYFLQRWFFGPFTFTANQEGIASSQNQWFASGAAEQYVTVVRGQPRQRRTIFESWPDEDIGSLYFSRGIASMAATRVVQEYAGISTAVPGDLFLSMRVPVTTRVSIERLFFVNPNWIPQFFPNYASASQTYEAVFHLSKAQEYALASGAAVQVVVPNTSSRTTPVTDPNSPFPGYIEDINRHVWTLQAS